MKLMHGIPVWGDPVDYAAVDQIQRSAAADERVVAAALMADHHKGYGVPIGGVVAYKDAISPSGVGFDIGCGVKAIRTNLTAGRLLGTKDLDKVLDEIQSTVEFGMGRKNAIAIDHPVMDSPLWDEVPQHIADLKGLA